MSEVKKYSLGDQHFGKSVELIDDGTTKHLLKPRDARVEKALGAFLKTLKQEGFPFLPSSEYVLEDGADWYKSALVKHLPAKTSDDVKLFFNRSGALLFLSYLLCSNDLHMENVVACQNSIVIVDAETLINGEPEKSVHKLVGLSNSVTASHLLPVHWKYIDGRLWQTAGLFTDSPNDRNMLYFNSEVCQPYDYLEDITSGFTAFYHFTMQHFDIIRDAVRVFEGCRFRKILRPTECYAKFIDIVQKFPEDKRATVAETLLAEAHKRDKRENRLDFMRKTLDKEVESVVRGDIPHFTSLYESRDLFCGGENVRKDFLRKSPHECVLERLDNLNAGDCEAQKRIIIQSLDAVRPIEQRVLQPAATTDPIRAAFEKLENGCISVISTQWIKLEAAQNNNLYLQNAGWGLYSGLTGILCAYAAFYYRTGNRVYLDALTEHFRSLKVFIDSIERSISISDNSGRLQDGIGGILNALLHICDLTGERVFYEYSVRLAEKLTPSFDGNCGDLLCGAAGLALALPKLPETIAAPLAEVLLPKLAEFKPTLTGAAHGAAGIALAVAAVQRVLKTNEYDKNIIDFISFEETYYSSEKHNWRDLRDETLTGAYMNGWCSGAGGVAMSRKRLFALTDNEEIKALCARDLERAAVNLSSDTVMKRDSLCCGNASRLMAASCIGVKNDGLHERLCQAICADALTLVHLNDTCDHVYGLMQGVAGAGYAAAMYGDEKSGGMLL